LLGGFYLGFSWFWAIEFHIILDGLCGSTAARSHDDYDE
jgi:hypothetical protein